MSENGKKFDNGKPPMHLLSYSSRAEIASALAYGAKKYGEYNYREGLKQSRVWDAIERHLGQWSDGQDNDEESGLPHLAHAGAGIIMLLDLVRLHPNLDDRWRLQDGSKQASDNASNSK